MTEPQEKKLGRSVLVSRMKRFKGRKEKKADFSRKGEKYTIIPQAFINSTKMYFSIIFLEDGLGIVCLICTPRPGCHDVVATMLREDQIDLDGIERNLVKYWPHVVFEQDFKILRPINQLLSVIQKAWDCTFPTVLIREITDYINIRSPVSKGNREFDFRGNQLEECFCFKSNNAPFQHIEQSYSPGDILKNTPLLLKRIVNSMQKEKIFPICDISSI